MRRAGIAAAMCLLAVGCVGGSGGDPVVRVDFRHDEFASHYWRFFPRTVYAHPGDEILFQQDWTGEPHTVSFGSIVDRVLPRVAALEKTYEEDPPETDEGIAAAEAAFEAASRDLPIFDAYTDLDTAAAINPCYLDEGMPPQGFRLTRSGRRPTGSPCPDREQPAFDGSQAFHSSGFIAPDGPRGNTYRLKLADDIGTGTYNYYCVIHFPDMQGRLVVRDADDELPSGAEMSRRARDEIEDLARPLRRAFAAARGGRAEDPAGDRIEPPIAGYHSGEEFTVAVDEFVPKILHAQVNEPITWTITGAHTVSFGVPRYVSIYTVRDDGSVERNPVVDRAAGGSPKPPPVDFAKGPVEIDAGTWDGSGFISSGLLGAEPVSRYTLRVSEPGRYRYACLVHPGMVATLIVEE